MITNHILEDKWRVQRELSEQAGYDSAKYLGLMHQKALDVQERYGVHFKYVQKANFQKAKKNEEKRSHGNST